VVDEVGTRRDWSAAITDWPDPRALPPRNDRRHPLVDHLGRVSRRRFPSPHPDALSATKRQRRIDRRKLGAAAAAVNQAVSILRYSKHPVARARAISALQAALRAASREMRRILLTQALRATSPGLSVAELSRYARIEDDTGPLGTHIVTAPSAPHAPPAVAVAPRERWTMATAVG